MGNGTTEKTGPGTTPHDALGMHPLDAWLRRELQALHGGCTSDPLPRDIAELARRLEEVLDRADDDQGAAPEHGRLRTSAAKR